jgi:hypothetical protein
LAKNPSTKTIKTGKAIAAYTWIDRPSIKYKKYEVTLKLSEAEIAELRAVAQELIDETLSPKKAKAVQWNPFKPMKDDKGEETPVVKARSGFAPDVFNAKGVQLAYPPRVGPGSTLKCGISFEIQDRDDKLQLLCRLKSVQIIKLVEGGGTTFADESEDEDAYTGEGGTAPVEKKASAKADGDDETDGETDPTKF